MAPASTTEPDDPSPRVPVEVTVDAAEAELVSDRLFALGAIAVTERTLDDGRVGLVADVDPTDVEALGLEWSPVDVSVDWVERWRRGAAAWRCGERLLVRPEWVPAPPTPPGAPDPVEVLVDPGATFGAGSHATTRLSLAALEPLAPTAGRVLDVGSGSGVLGVAALRCGAGALVAIDIDPEAVAATRRAVELNDCTGRAEVGGAPLHAVRGTFDLVLANVLVPVLEELGPQLVAHVAPGGAAVVSGFLVAQRNRAVQAMAPLVVTDERHEDGWVAVTLSHPTTASDRPREL